MKVKMFTKDEKCENIISVNVCHMTMFEKHEICLHFNGMGNMISEDQIKFLEVCIKNHILVEVQGHEVTIIPEPKNFQRVRFRFDS